jgi:eukaryotic-like serine/threonine-protein kinase
MASLLNVLIGEYRVSELLGAGGMGEVYKATHTHFGRVIAVKVLTSGESDPATVKRFYSEAKIQASLRHPGVAEYLGFYEYHGRPCILMEYVDGLTIASILERRGALPPQEAFRIAQAIAAVVANFHEHGVLHRDIKTNNIKICSDGRVKVLDFGIARLQSTRNLTSTGVVIGTPGMLAPEQISGQKVTPATDVWQFGVMVYEMLSGRLPFRADNTRELYAQILNAKHAPLITQPSLPAGFEKVINRCLQKDPAKRYASGRELLAALDALEGRKEPAPGPTPRFEPLVDVKPPGSLRLVGALAGGVVVLIAIVVGVVQWSRPTTADLGISPCVEPSSETETPSGEIRTVTLSTVGVSAQVFCGGHLVGMTPYPLKAKVGDKVNLVLRSEGYKPKDVSFNVTERAEYNESLDRVGEP